MENTPPQVIEVSNGTLWFNPPVIVALFFALAGAFFIGILLIRRRRNK